MARDVVVRGQAGRSTKREISGAQHRDTAVSLSLFRKADSQRSSNPSAPKKYDSSTALIYRQRVAPLPPRTAVFYCCRYCSLPIMGFTKDVAARSRRGTPSRKVSRVNAVCLLLLCIRERWFSQQRRYTAVVVQADGIMASCNRCEMWHPYNKLRFPEKGELSTAGKLTLEVGKWKRRWKVKGSERGL